MTFMIRPSVSGPTGTVIGSPVSETGLTANQTFGRVHGDRADFVFTKMLGHFQNEAVAAVRVSSAFRIAGSSPSKATSTTAPITCVTLPAEPAAVFLGE
jgi:hypothetical protein